MSKLNNWSESRGQTDDMMHALGPESGSAVNTLTARRGIVLLCNCENCGRQWKGIIPWGEVAMYFLGHPVPNVKATRQGLMTALKCNSGTCPRPFTMVLDWDEVRRWVDIGIRSGALDPKIRQAVRQVSPPKRNPPGRL